MTTGATMTDAHTPRPFVRRHHWMVRITHWVTVVVLAGMITSGLQIYEAYARFGNRGGPYFPSPLDGTQFPHWSRLGGWLAGALNWHFALMWPLVTAGLLYLGYLVKSGEWRALLFRPRDVPGALAMAAYYLRLRKDHPPQGKHNPLQKLAYSSIYALGVLAVMTNRQTPRRHDAKLHEADRRAFVKLGVAGAGAALAAACGWDGGGAIRPLLLDWSRVNDWVGEKVLFSPTHLARTYSPAQRSAMLPSYFISDMTPVLSDPDRWRLRVQGLVEQPLDLSLDDLMRLPRTSYTVKHHCVEGWSAISSWHGVAVSALAERCGMLPQARYVRFDSFDSGYSNGWDLASAMHPQTILAYGMNDNPLPPTHGAPLRLYSPTKLGYKMTKYLVSLTFTAERPGGYWEDQGYPWFGGV